MTKDVMRVSMTVLSTLLGLTCLADAAQAQTFSADLVITKAGGRPNGQVGHLYVSSAKVRIETPDLADGFFIVDGDRSAAWFVRPQRQEFMDAKQSSPLTQLLVPVDPTDPCQQWQAMAKIAGAADRGGEWRCDRLGEDTVDGRETVKYRAISPQNRRSYGWIDTQRKFPVRLEAEDGTTVAVENIVDASQPSSLFAVPPGYVKFDPLQLIERVKQSDVWVEPPK